MSQAILIPSRYCTRSRSTCTIRRRSALWKSGATSALKPSQSRAAHAASNRSAVRVAAFERKG